ncbi:MAG: hypothetical protein NZL85_03160, partial [Fimbriimonadales bacterium]|nr:hypothetical protein [Fimbriimonadales bacterium]
MKVLIIAETNGQQISEKSLPAVAFAQQVASAEFHILAIGHALQGMENLTGYGAQSLWLADDPMLARPLAERYAPVVVHAVRQLGAELIVATTTTFSRDLLARVAGLLNAPMLSDIITFTPQEGRYRVKRPIYSANLIGTFEVEGAPVVLTVRGPAWGKPSPVSNSSPVQRLALPGDIPTRSEWLSLQ